MTKEAIKITAINKIKINNDKTAIISYVQSEDLSCSEIVHTGKEKVTDEFFKKFQETVSTFCGILSKLKPDANQITMNAIKFSYNSAGVLEKVLYSVKYQYHTAGNAFVNISTPMIPIHKEHFDEKTFCIAGSDETLLHDIVKLAKAYINGDTGTVQGKLNLVVENEEG